MSSSTPVVSKTPAAQPSSLSSNPDPEVRAFYEQLSPKDKLIHDLAVQMLKTRYIPQRSTAWTQWKSKALKK
jgi:hypothetical protein